MQDKTYPIAQPNPLSYGQLFREKIVFGEFRNTVKTEMNYFMQTRLNISAYESIGLINSFNIIFTSLLVNNSLLISRQMLVNELNKETRKLSKHGNIKNTRFV